MVFYFKTPGFYHIASLFDMQINIKARVDVNQDGPSLIIDNCCRNKLYDGEIAGNM